MIRREPGEVEFWSGRLKEWIESKTVCYVSESELCAKSGCNRKLKHATSKKTKNPVNGRFCTHQHSADYIKEKKEEKK